MPEIVKNTYDYLVGVQLHPLITVVTLMIITVGRQRWEEVEEDCIKKRKIGQNILFFALLVSILGQVALYVPMDFRDGAVCFFMAFGQVGVASFVYTFSEKFGIVDRLGRFVQKKIDDKTEAPFNPPRVV